MSILTSTSELKVMTKPLIIYKSEKQASAIAQMENEIGVEHLDDGEYKKCAIIYPISVKSLVPFYNIVFKTAVCDNGQIACNICGVFDNKTDANECYNQQESGEVQIDNYKAFVTLGNMSVRLSE